MIAILGLVRTAARVKLLFLPHAVRPMAPIIRIRRNGTPIVKQGGHYEMHPLPRKHGLGERAISH